MRFTDALLNVRASRIYPLILVLFPPLYFMEVWLWLTAYRVMMAIPVVGIFLVPDFPLHARGK